MRTSVTNFEEDFKMSELEGSDRKLLKEEKEKKKKDKKDKKEKKSKKSKSRSHSTNEFDLGELKTPVKSDEEEEKLESLKKPV